MHDARRRKPEKVFKASVRKFPKSNFRMHDARRRKPEKVFKAPAY